LGIWNAALSNDREVELGLVACVADDGVELGNIVRELVLVDAVDIKARPAPPASCSPRRSKF
jgi:hypothetical protein